MSWRADRPAGGGRSCLLGVLVVAVLVAAWGRVRPLVTPAAAPPPPLATVAARDGCRAEAWRLVVGQGSAQDGGIRFATNGVAAARVCTAGVLRATLGSNAPGATLVVARGVDPVWSGSVGTATPLEVTVDGPTWLAVAYLNDARVDGRSRDAWIRDLQFEPAP